MADQDPRVPEVISKADRFPTGLFLDQVELAAGMALDVALERLFEEQSAVVMSMDPATLSALKAEFQRARKAAVSRAGNILHDPDVERAATEALGYPVDEKVLRLKARAKQVLEEPFSILSGAGFDPWSPRGAVRSRRLESAIKNAFKQYGQVALDLKTVNYANASSAWAQA